MHRNTISDTMRKHNPLHIFTLQRTLNREDKVSESQLLNKRFDLTLGTQHFTNSKLKMAHHESVTFSKYS